MLRVLKVNKAYGGRLVLNHAQLSLKPGGCLCLMGPSGSGKSTLLRVVAGLLKPDSGNVFVDDNPLYSAGSGQVESSGFRPWPRLGMVFQDLKLFPNLSGYENVELGIKNAIPPLAPLLTRELAQELGIGDAMDRRPSEMSQGQQQRLAIIRALARYPQYLLLDEPTSALDHVSRDKLSSTLRKFADEGTAFLIATHDWTFAEQMRASFLPIVEGRVGYAGTLPEAVEIIARGGRFE